MVSPVGYKRDYKQESKTARKRGEHIDNKYRKRARRKLEREGKVKPFDGKDVDHKNRNPRNNTGTNLRAVSATKNRSFKRSGKHYGNGKRK